MKPGRRVVCRRAALLGLAVVLLGSGLPGAVPTASAQPAAALGEAGGGPAGWQSRVAAGGWDAAGAASAGDSMVRPAKRPAKRRAPADTAPATCALTASGADTQGRLFVTVTVQDAGSGLAAIATPHQDNATVDLPAFTRGTTNPLRVTGTQIDATDLNRLTLEITDVAGNKANCDLISLFLPREPGRQVNKEVAGLPQAQSKVTVKNGSPGLVHLDIDVNPRASGGGTHFDFDGLQAGEVRTVDTAAGMAKGNENVITFTGRGTPGGTVAVVIS